MSGWRSDLVWHYANGHRVNPQHSTGMPDGGVRGNGCSGTKGVFRDFSPDLAAMARYGRVSRALATLSDEHRRVLDLGYGDVGAAMTECSLRPGDRWKAVAPMTQAITEHMPTKGRAQLAKMRGKVPLDERKRDLTCGPVAVHLTQHLLSKTAPSTLERETIGKVRDESNGLLRAAEAAFAAAWVPPSWAEVEEARCG